MGIAASFALPQIATSAEQVPRALPHSGRLQGSVHWLRFKPRCSPDVAVEVHHKLLDHVGHHVDPTLRVEGQQQVNHPAAADVAGSATGAMWHALCCTCGPP